MSTPKLTIFFAAALLLLSGCGASVKMLGSWVDESKPEYKVKDVLVLGMDPDVLVRNLWENTFSELLAKDNVVAYPYNKVMGIEEGQPESREAILEAVKKSGVKAVLITRTVGIDKETKTLPGFLHYQPEVFSAGLGSYYGAAYSAVYHPPRDVTRTTFRIETNLYDAASEKLIWSAQTEAIDTNILKTDFAMVARSLIKDMRSKDLL